MKTKEQRRYEAATRQEMRNKLSAAQQLKVLAQRPGQSKKETQRLKEQA